MNRPAGGGARGAPSRVIHGRIPGRPGLWELALDGARIGGCACVDPSFTDSRCAWITPGLFDVQVNGIQGVDYSRPAVSQEELARADLLIRSRGISRYCPTLITAGLEEAAASLEALRTAAEAGLIPGAWGVHLEGPWISSEDGYRGVHSRAHARDPSVAELERLDAASGGRIRLITLAPERAGAMDLIRAAAGRGIAVSLGHTNAPRAVVAEAVRAGARLSTHLFNGCAQMIDRHSNVVYSQLAEDGLSACFIADGNHVPWPALKIGLRAKGPDRSILVSDIVPLSGSPDGEYESGGYRVVLRDGGLFVKDSWMLCGAVRTLDQDVGLLGRRPEPGIEAALLMATRNPARALGEEAWAEMRPGREGPVAVFAWDGEELSLRDRIGF
jgi:N-acetylglucosamine-6-phosphate deacetylase